MENPIMTFLVNGVQLVKEPFHTCNQNGCGVILHNITAQTGGSYRCEVSGDAPSFRLTYKVANMSIIGIYTCQKEN